MNSFDEVILTSLNRYAGRWPDFDRSLAFLSTSDLVKGAVPVTVLWGLWFARSGRGDSSERRLRILTAFLATAIALAFNRVAASLLPHRPRPLQLETFDFRAPIGMSSAAFADLSAFPSDHAVMFAGLAAGAWLVSARAGMFLAAHALVVVLVPRVYLGLHYPTDIVAGLFVGIAFVALGIRYRKGAPAKLLSLGDRRPGMFHAALFLLTFGFATLFHPAVRIVEFIRTLR